MAEIAPAVPAVAAAAPAAPVALANAASPISPDQDFLNQLTAALKTLSGVAAALKGISQSAPVIVDATVDSAAPAKDEPTDASKADTPAPPPTDDVLELLASLGVVPVPQPQAVPTSPAHAHTVSAPITPTLTAAAALQTPAASATPPQAEAAPPTHEGDHSSVEHTTTTPPTTGEQHTLTTTDTKKSASAPATPVDSAAPAQVEMASAPQPQSAPVQHAPTAPATHTVEPQPAFQQNADSDTHSGSESSQQHSSTRATPVDTVASTDAAPSPERVFTVAAPTTPLVNAPQTPANVHPTQVVNQIEQQVDLYRLPGARGVRIQLHPEDLGGVQVTLRYANGGNLELHISVEHAATGALVQAGMPQLRDALAKQGFHPDRLVMSVTAPAASTSGQMDFSSNNNNGSYRSDTSGMAGFMQNGQSGQQRGNEPRGDAPTFSGWTGDTAPAAEETPRAPTSNSRIDYRV